MKTALVLALACATALHAQTPPQNIPIRALAPVSARTSITVEAIGGVQHLPDGRLLVNDIRARRLLVFDSTLAKVTVIADTSVAIGHYTGRFGLPLIPYLADSSLFVDFDSQSLIMIEPSGKMGRVMSAPIPKAATSMNAARADAKGRLVYRQAAPTPMIPNGRGGMTVGPFPDSTLIVRADFETRRLDTLASIRVYPPPRPTTSTDANGKVAMRRTVNLVPPPLDEFTVLSDGSIALVRGSDYHVDWIYADGTRASTPKMPFDWRRLTDDDKRAKVDSAKKLLDSLSALGKNPNIAIAFGVKPETVFMAIDYAPIDSMGSYVAPIRTGSVRADADGNLWILPTTTLQAKGGLLYDVVNKKGEVFERVQLPADRDIAGFGRGGIIYLSQRDGPAGFFYIERTKVIRPAGGTIRPRPAPGTVRRESFVPVARPGAGSPDR